MRLSLGEDSWDGFGFWISSLLPITTDAHRPRCLWVLAGAVNLPGPLAISLPKFPLVLLFHESTVEESASTEQVLSASQVCSLTGPALPITPLIATHVGWGFSGGMCPCRSLAGVQFWETQTTRSSYLRAWTFQLLPWLTLLLSFPTLSLFFQSSKDFKKENFLCAVWEQRLT